MKPLSVYTAAQQQALKRLWGYIPHRLPVVHISTVLFVLGLGAGLLASAQWRTKPTRVLNPVAPYASLAEARERLENEQKTLKTEIASLQGQITQAQTQLKSHSSTDRGNLETLERLKEELGLAELRGSGVKITFDDSKIDYATVDSIVHAADLRDLINSLWAWGARAISISGRGAAVGERIVGTSSVDCIVNTILVNNVRLSPPFDINVVGDERYLLSQLSDTKNLPGIYDRVKNTNLIFTIETNHNLNIPPYRGGYSSDYVRAL